MKHQFGALLTATVVLAAASQSAAQGPTTHPSGATKRPSDKALDGRLKHIKLDVPGRVVVIAAEVCRRTGPLEFLLCKGATKSHESILKTHALPSTVHAALLSLGLTAGKPARWTATGEGDQARFMPPQGAAVSVTVRWRDADGKAHQANAADWLVGSGTRQPPRADRWIFVGSQILPDGRYWADIEGELISVANFASSVIDVPFESTDKNALLEFVANEQRIPPVGTGVEVVIAPLPGAAKAPDARALLEVDCFGRYVLDGQPMPPERLSDWARRYIARHAKGQVVVRVDARALAFDVAQARQALADGGVRDIEVVHLPPAGSVLPRTTQQARRSLDWWARRFAMADELISDPGQDARAALEQIRLQLRRLEAMGELWADYASQLQAQLRAYEASTQPAGPETNGQ